MKLSKIQKKHWEWAKRNFGKPPAYQALLGAVEEIGELSHSYIKASQGIRGTSAEMDSMGKDAVADTILFLMQYCSIKGWNMQDILEGTAKEVWKRDWKAYPETGYPDDELDGDPEDMTCEDDDGDEPCGECEYCCGDGGPVVLKQVKEESEPCHCDDCTGQGKPCISDDPFYEEQDQPIEDGEPDQFGNLPCKMAGPKTVPPERKFLGTVMDSKQQEVSLAIRNTLLREEFARRIREDRGGPGVIVFQTPIPVDEDGEPLKNPDLPSVGYMKDVIAALDPGQQFLMDAETGLPVEENHNARPE